MPRDSQPPPEVRGFATEVDAMGWIEVEQASEAVIVKAA
jgi:hypothetical protein